MTDHLSSATLNALVDQELSIEQAAIVKEHLDDCPACTSTALTQALLKTAVAKAGQRYAASTHLRERLRRLSAGQTMTSPSTPDKASSSRSAWWITSSALAAAAVLLIVAASWMLMQRQSQHIQLSSQIASVERAALVNEVLDQHIATLAADQPPQVLSSDRHTVKPWFQGKLPFSFNLPDNLPDDTKLDGANLDLSAQSSGSAASLQHRPPSRLRFDKPETGRRNVESVPGRTLRLSRNRIRYR